MTVDRDALRARLRALFLDELEQHVLVLNRGLVALEQGPAGGDTAVLVNQMFRSAHSLKGAAQAAAVEPVAGLCHALEAALARLRDGRADPGGVPLEPLFEAVDALATAGRQLREEGDVTGLPVTGIVRSLSATAGSAPAASATAGSPPAVERRPHAVAPERAEGDRRVQPTPAQSPERSTLTAVRVPAGRLEALLSRAGEMVLACERVHAVATRSASPEAAAADRLLTSAQRALADAVRQTGMVPFSEACAGLDRVTRDVAHAAGKQASLVVRGGDVEMDRPILDGLREPLLHLVRNAVDHGIEPASERVAAAKQPSGTVTVEASLQGAMVAVAVSDDGRGIDAERVRTAAARRGIGASRGDHGDDVLDLVFAPGVSTAPFVSEVSGRGVGLDAVRAGVEALGGSVGIESRPGAGARVTLLVPVTRSVTRVVLVASGQEVVALPTSGVVRMASASVDDLRVVEGRTMLLSGGRLLPVASLSHALGTDVAEPAPGAPLHVVIVDTQAGDAVLVVDGLVSEQEAVVKPPPPRLAGLPGVLGATILPTGRVALVVNPATAVRTAMGSARPLPAPVGAEEPPLRRRVLLVDDTLTTRTLERSILETAGYDVVVAVDGANALEVLEAQGADVDAVVSDVNMPRMDGLALCEAVRSSSRLRHLPVVLVTSLASEEDRRRGVEAGADAYIAKSEFDQSMLLDTLARLL